MNTVVALLSLLRLGHLPFLRPRLVPRTLAPPHVATSMQIQRNVVNCLYFRDAPPSITHLQPTKNAFHVEKCRGAYQPFAAPRSAPLHDIVFCDVHKCQPFREPAPASTLSRPPENASHVAHDGTYPRPVPLAVVGRQSSVVGHQSQAMSGNVAIHTGRCLEPPHPLLRWTPENVSMWGNAGVSPAPPFSSL